MERKPDPPPLRTNDGLAVRVGVLLWAAALVVALLTGNAVMLWTSVAGITLGVVGMVVTKRRAAATARDEAGPDGARAGGPFL